MKQNVNHSVASVANKTTKRSFYFFQNHRILAISLYRNERVTSVYHEGKSIDNVETYC